MSMKKVAFHAAFNERTGYGIHATRFAEQLKKLCILDCDDNSHRAEGDIHISLVDTCSIGNMPLTKLYPVHILYNVWESTEQPPWVIERLQYFDQFWVPSEWQKAASIAQGIPEEFIRVVPEGVDPEKYFPLTVDQLVDTKTFNFVHVGQWQPRKSTKEIVQTFLRSFPKEQFENVRLYLSADTLFPSDCYKSTEERLAAYGLSDPRIIPIHYEERDSYIRRLQNAHCFVSCARSEGWGLPIIEAMACGIPTIVADWSGSTEYARDAIRVPFRKLIKPYGIYGNWDVPGEWCEPNFDVLAEKMKMVYENYSGHKERALKLSEKIRTKFSWDAAAKTAIDIISEFPKDSDKIHLEHNLRDIAALDNKVPDLNQQIDVTKEIEAMKADVETKVRAFARQYGFEIEGLRKQKIIFTMDTHPDNPEKVQCLKESIQQVKALGYPLLLTSHIPLPPEIVAMVDFHVYDKRDILSGEDRPVYSRVGANGQLEYTKSRIPCHALASTMNVRNGIDFCLGKYDWIYHMSSDCEVDLKEWVRQVQLSKKSLIGIRWDNQQNTFGGQMIAGTTEVMDKLLPHMETWEEFVKEYGDQRFNSEEGMLRRAIAAVGADGFDILDMKLGNRFDQVDREVWPDDQFQCHFVEGPFLNIIGLSKQREYDVTWGNPIDGACAYQVKQRPGMWSRPSKKFYREWTVTARLNGEIKFQHTLNLEGRNVLISLGSKALGDTIAWIPYVEEFRKKHRCNVYLSTWWNQIFDYPNIKFITPGAVIENVYASYEIGCFDLQPDKNPTEWRKVPLQQVAADQLGIVYEPIKPTLANVPLRHVEKKYICFSEFSTMQAKLWNNPGAWQKVIDALVAQGYECVAISSEQSHLSGIVNHCGQPINKTLQDLAGAEFYLGLNAGPTWLAIAAGCPVFMITGVSEPWNDYPGIHRISVDVCRPGCFNDPTIPIDRGWDWCPRKRDYACTREITPEMVLQKIEEFNKRREENASKIKSSKKVDGDSGASPRSTKKRKPRNLEDGQKGHARLRVNQREGVAQAH